ncbi:MAG TPA: response regulator [Xanthobacteraceae bacterium]|jgi:two-component system response regulator FixJ
MSDAVRIALIDDDAAVLDSLRLYLLRQNLDTSCFPSAEDFLSSVEDAARFDCVVSDVSMPGMSGLELLGRLADRGVRWPVILITGHGDVDMAVKAMKAGAFDFVEKPFDEIHLLETIRNSLERNRRQTRDDAEIGDLRKKFDGLSARQRQVMELAASGLSSKEIARRLDISAKTVENHRAWVMERIGARNLAELVRMAIKVERNA